MGNFAKDFLTGVVLPYEGDDCLIWPYSKTRLGYGQVRIGGKLLSVSTLACEEQNGPSPAPHLDAAHTCGNGHLGCVSRKHLAWKSREENIRDKIQHGTHGKKLRIEEATQILDLVKTNDPAEIASMFGITISYVHALKRGVSWKFLGKSAPVKKRHRAKDENGTTWASIAKRNGINGRAYNARLSYGWSPQQAATHPLHTPR